ncbi:hypothetical protein GALL_158090 [mine drainage metagenome]|uniref:Uncharacterized protein n=1 Tax=mine drainage metagenome TaxID=410659 RepID=A0A1J5SDB4_9ZZZZ
MDDERTTQEVIQLLGDDCDRCHAELLASIEAGERHADGYVEADYEFHARQLSSQISKYTDLAAKADEKTGRLSAIAAVLAF